MNLLDTIDSKNNSNENPGIMSPKPNGSDSKTQEIGTEVRKSQNADAWDAGNDRTNNESARPFSNALADVKEEGEFSVDYFDQ